MVSLFLDVFHNRLKKKRSKKKEKAMLEWTVLFFLSYSYAYSYAYYLHTPIPLVTRNILLHETGITGASKRSKRSITDVTFGGVQFQDPLSSSLRRLNIAESPSPIQEVAISPLSNGESYFLHAPTGTGKTFAYLLPVLKQLYEMKKKKALSALIIVPSKELASQVKLNTDCLFLLLSLTIF